MDLNVKERTARGFVYEWQRFSVAPWKMKDNFRGYFQFYPPSFFQRKRVL